MFWNREVDGVLTAFQIRISEGGEEMIVFSVSEAKYNSGLADSLFRMEK